MFLRKEIEIAISYQKGEDLHPFLWVGDEYFSKSIKLTFKQ